MLQRGQLRIQPLDSRRDPRVDCRVSPTPLIPERVYRAHRLFRGGVHREEVPRVPLIRAREPVVIVGPRVRVLHPRAPDLREITLRQVASLEGGEHSAAEVLLVPFEAVDRYLLSGHNGRRRDDDRVRRGGERVTHDRHTRLPHLPLARVEASGCFSNQLSWALPPRRPSRGRLVVDITLDVNLPPLGDVTLLGDRKLLPPYLPVLPRALFRSSGAEALAPKQH
mmetsp:Transcript_7563/g.18243  ORF Transcript_7563/g.18243 Transcript_7563/m.18243 type:complete len:224 (-) Transcript_7563:872-1543(-)